MVPRYESLVLKHESLVPKHESLVPKHERLLQKGFTVYKITPIGGPGGFHPVALKIGTLQLLRTNLNGIELPTADGLYGMTRLCYRSGW